MSDNKAPAAIDDQSVIIPYKSGRISITPPSH